MEQNSLIFTDLCGRLPYGVKVNIVSRTSNRDVTITASNIRHIIDGWWDDYKPYLFPLESMTEEQYNEMQNISGEDCLKHMELEKEWRNNSLFNHLPLYQHRVIEFFHKYHFDYRGLIPMGEAIDATNLNIY